MLSTVVNLLFGAYEPLFVYRLRAQLGVSSGGTGAILAIAGAAVVATAVLLAWRQSRVPAELPGRVAGACRSAAYAGDFGGAWCRLSCSTAPSG